MSRDGYVIGVDIGTTAAKAAAFGLDGRHVATSRARYDWLNTQDGIELEADNLAAHAASALSGVLSELPPGQVHGVGFASLAESSVVLDDAARPLTPVIAWHDKRDTDQLRDLDSMIGADTFSRTTGLPFRQQWSLTKYRWMRDHGATLSAASLRLNVAEWVAFALGADAVAEQSLASRTGWLDIANRCWWAEALDWSGLDKRILPRLVGAGEPIGILNGLAHPRLTGAVATIAGHDHQAAAVGLGATEAGDEIDSSGTAEALVRTVEPIDDPDRILALTRIGATVGWHALPGAWCVLAATEGGLDLSRVLADLDMADPLEIEAKGKPAARETWAKAAAAATDEVGALDEAVNRIIGARGRLIVTGGWARSAEIMAAKRRRFGSLVRPAVEEAGARGAAIFAGKAAGLWETEKPWPTPLES